MRNKIDRLVAECVMGFPVIDELKRAIPSDGNYVPDWRRLNCEPPPQMRGRDFRPSTNMTDAMVVHSKLRLCILAIQMPDGSDGWQVRRFICGCDATSTNHKSICMAICIASLRVSGVTEAEIEDTLNERH